MLIKMSDVIARMTQCVSVPARRGKHIY